MVVFIKCILLYWLVMCITCWLWFRSLGDWWRMFVGLWNWLFAYSTHWIFSSWLCCRSAWRHGVWFGTACVWSYGLSWVWRYAEVTLDLSGSSSLIDYWWVSVDGCSSSCTYHLRWLGWTSQSFGTTPGCWSFIFFSFIVGDHASWCPSVHIRFRHWSHSLWFCWPTGIADWLPRIYDRMSLSHTVFHLRWPIDLMLLLIHKLIHIIHPMHLFVLSVPLFSLPLPDDLFLLSFLLGLLLLFEFSFTFSLEFF